MEGNNTTTRKGKSRLFRGRTKHVLLALSVVLILACILAIPLVSGQTQAYALPQTNSANPSGGISLKNSQIATLGGTGTIVPNMSLVGNMTTIGDTAVNGLLDVSDFDRLIIGPLTSYGSQNITAQSIYINQPTKANEYIELTGTPEDPSTVTICGNVTIGNQATSTRISAAMIDYYQYIVSQGTGYIGSIDGTPDLPLNTSDAIKVHQGQLQIHAPMAGELLSSDITITNTTCTIVANVVGIGLMTVNVDLAPYNGWANISQLKADGKLIAYVLGIPVDLGSFIGAVQQATYLQWNTPTTFEAKGAWFILFQGVFDIRDSSVLMKSKGTMRYWFLNATSDAIFKITNSTHYPQAVMNVTTIQQKINGTGNTYITKGSLAVNNAIIKQQNQLINCTLAFQGDMNQTGEITIQGDIGISGYNYMQGLITIKGDMNINDGSTTGKLTLAISNTMETTGTMTITNGEIKLPSNSTLVMNSTGSFITGTEINVSGDQITSQGNTEVDGDFAIISDIGESIGISGHSYMNGLITIVGDMNINNQTTGTITLNIDGTMESSSDGSMKILHGVIAVPGGHVVMNDTGAYIQSTYISITGEQISSQGTTEVSGEITMSTDEGESLTMGSGVINGPVAIENTQLNINGGAMSGTGSITVSSGYMQTIGTMTLTSATVNVIGKIIMDLNTGTTIHSQTTIQSESIDVSGTVINTGMVTMTGDFMLLIPMSVTGIMVSDGIMYMGALGTIAGVMTITGNTIMTGVTTISGTNNIIGSMSVGPVGTAITGIVGLQGIVTTTNTPSIGSSTILEMNAATLMGMSVPHMSIMADPIALIALGIMILGTIYVVARSVYIGYQDRRMLVQLPGVMLIMLKERAARLSQAIKKLFGGSGS